MIGGRVVIILTLILLIVAVVHIATKRYVRWEEDYQERKKLQMLPLPKEPSNPYLIIGLFVGAIIFFLLLPV